MSSRKFLETFVKQEVYNSDGQVKMSDSQVKNKKNLLTR